jgi:hypothetical protein
VDSKTNRHTLAPVQFSILTFLLAIQSPIPVRQNSIHISSTALWTAIDITTHMQSLNFSGLLAVPLKQSIHHGEMFRLQSIGFFKKVIVFLFDQTIVIDTLRFQLSFQQSNAFLSSILNQIEF